MGLFEVLLSFICAPYYGSLQQYTLSPIQGLAAEKDLSQFKEKLYSWQAAKAHELKVVQVASGLTAAAIVSIFSWPDVPQTFWLARGLWYWSLSLAVWAFLIASQQVSVLGTVKDVDTEAEMVLAKKKIARLSPKGSARAAHYALLYFWQCASMHMSYSWMTFLVALLIHVCRPIVPLIRHGIWTADTKVMVFFIIAFGVGVINFGVCAVISRSKVMREEHTTSVPFVAGVIVKTRDVELGKGQ